MTNPTYGNGYDQADLMIIGDYTRKGDLTAMQCLSGYYKKKLDEFLQSANFDVDLTYRTCIIKEYIQGLGVGTWGQDKKLLNYYFETEDASLAETMTILVDEINLIKPTTIIALGEYALRILTDKEGIRKWRGSVLPLAMDIASRLADVNWTIKVIATYHPNIVHTEEHQQFIMRLDYKKAIEILQNPNKAIDYHEIYICKSSMDLLRFLEQYPAEQYPEMTYDIETRYGFITCAGISFDGYRGICIPLYGATQIDMIDRCRMAYILSQLLAERNLINQNIAYDRRISNRFGLQF